MKLCNIILTGCGGCLLLGGAAAALTLTPDGRAQMLFLLLLTGMGLLNLAYYVYFRIRFIRFTDEVCRFAENAMAGRKSANLRDSETLTAKVATELEKLEDILSFQAVSSQEERLDLQKSISEIVHQIKTPVSNIRMYHDMLSDPELDGEETRRFMWVIRRQLEKLEFLIETLIKTSRLESEMIKLQPENTRIFDTLTESVNNIIRKAERKRIEISVYCRPSIQVTHDSKWTAEAIENILDNAVKYTPEDGKIEIRVLPGEMYTEIQIKDSGRGIEPGHINDIFKRFYREPAVAKTEGLGLGLYLARNIITLQGGYIFVRSEVGRGSCFSVCLPDKS